MKKVYLFASVLLVASASSAQLQKSIFDMDAPTLLTDNQKVGSHDNQINSERAGGDVFHTETFGTQGDWVTEDLTGHAQGTWEYGGPTPSALVPGYMTDISSTTKSDGYWYFHGVQYVLGTVDVQYTSIKTANSINCSSRPGVILNLEQSYRAFNTSEVLIGVSTDGSTWTDYPVNSAVQSNSGTTDDISLNISAIAGNELDVYIRFVWSGNSTGGYGWIVDDMTLTEAFQNDVSQNSLFANDIITSYEYTKVPQVQGTPLTVQAALTNNGYTTPSSVQSHVIVTNSSMGVELDATGGTLSGALAPGDEDTITFTTTLDMSTLAPDVYTITNIIEHSVADDVTSNDTLVTTLEVTDNIYSHFDPGASSLFYSNPGYNSTGAYDGFQFGVQFEVYANANLHGLDFYIDPGNSGATNYIATSEPQTVGIYIYDATADFQNPTFVDYKEFTLDGYTSGMNTFNFHMAENTPGAVALSGGNVYRACVEVLSGFSLWSVGEIPDEDFSSLMYGPFGAGQSTGWFSNSVEVGMNLNFDESLDNGNPLEIKEFNIGQNFPNPFDDNSTIMYTLNEGANVMVQFTDVSGKVIKTVNQGNQAAGTYQIEVNSAEFATGTYFYTFTIGDRKVTKKMTVK